MINNNGFFSRPQSLTSLGNGKAVFNSYDYSHGYELWVTDGTLAGTLLLEDIYVGNYAYSSNPANFTSLGNGKAVFTADDGSNGVELWITDGTAAGTHLVKDINTGLGSSVANAFQSLGNGKVLFTADNGINGIELWITDGTAVGTHLVKDVNVGPSSSTFTNISSLGNGKAMFSVDDAIHGRELWITDGTSTGTYLVKDINLGTASSYPSAVMAINIHHNFTGSAIGSMSDDVFYGSAGVDTMTGEAGNDHYYVNQTGDSVIENVSAGWDVVFSTVSYTLANHVERLILTGAANIQANGNAQNNRLDGNTGNNILNGLGGADTLLGDAGNDSYVVDNAGDVVTENGGAGLDAVYATISYALTANVENLVLTGTAISGTGNALNNYLVGNAANNTLTGWLGDDILIGGLGKDTINLTEPTASTDTVRFATGHSLVSSYDLINGFRLGTGISTAGVDKLDLVTTTIATNAATVNGVDAGIIHSHHIGNGIISFDDVNVYSTPLAITAANLPSVFSYLQANITGGKTVAFVSLGNTFVFQDGGVTDTLVELVGVAASSINATGLAAHSIWIV